MSDFKEFKKWFKYYQDKFDLSGWKVFFKQEPIEDGFANISVDLGAMAATVCLNRKLSDEDKPFKDIKLSAKHEACHLLCARLENNGRARYISSNEIYETAEELVNKLCGLIK